MIRFTCPSCREDLEGEEELRGRRMACPGCSSEIQIPGAATASRRVFAPGPAPNDRSAILTLGILTLLAVAGVAGFVLMRRSQERAAVCSPCEGTGRTTCGSCDGGKSAKCWNAGCDRGKVTTVAGVVIDCLTCGGQGTAPCRTCKGAGTAPCAGCRGEGRPRDP